MSRFTTVTPVDGSVYVEREHASNEQLACVLERATRVRASWRSVSIEERGRWCSAFVDELLRDVDDAAQELSWQIGRPIAQSPSEFRGFEERARTMIRLAEAALSPIEPGPKPGFTRFIERVPLGVVLVIAPWNYPYLTAVNSVVPALMAGNVVVLKHSAQTPLVAERFQRAFDRVGLPEGVFQHVHTTHEQTARLVESGSLHYVAFTGSVDGGRSVQKSAANRFLGMGLELGGKDPAYVRADAALEHAVANLVDGAFFNSGQSCCGIERIYAHEAIYDAFVEGFAALTSEYRLGNPLNRETTLGPVVRTQAAEFVRQQIKEALDKGARALIDPKAFIEDRAGTPYLAPQVLVDVDHSMSVMRDESFGPVVGIMKVKSDDQAIELMNASDFGLTASVWTRDEAAAVLLGRRVETGTFFMNRCDYLDPELAWTGVKDSGRGCSLSRLGYEVLTRPQSFHLRTDT